MKLMSFNFTKVDAKRENKVINKLTINNNLDIKEISEVKTSLLNTKDVLLNFEFSYKLNFDPDFAKINLEGNFILSLGAKDSKNILKNWKKKKIEEEMKISLFNIILKKCNLKSLQIEEFLNLPPHFKLPSLKLSSDKES